MNIKKGFTLIELIIVVAIIGILAAMSTPPRGRRPRPESLERDCFSNIRVLQGAVEMYNMDNSEMMKVLDIDRLIAGGYIKSAPNKPTPNCFYLGKNLDTDGYVFCDYHGEPSQKYQKTKRTDY